MANKISVVFDAAVDKAVASVKNFRTSIQEAEGVAGKFKAGATSAFDAVKANVGALAVGAGAALVGFGVKAVGAFTDTAKAAIDLSTSTGLAVEEASRWIAVGDDFEVGADALATGLGKVSKTLDDTKWSKYGVATRDASGEARSANDILLDTFDMLSQVDNKTEQARIGQELFGKGYQSLTPILGHTREEYERMLGSVEHGQVITANEAKQAEKMRLAQDQLGDAFKDVSIAAGGLLAHLAPVISLLAKGIGFVSNLTGSFVGLFTGVDHGTESFKKFFAETTKIPKSVQDIRAELSKMASAADENSGMIDRLWGFEEADSKAGLLNQTIQKMGKESPESVRGIVDSLQSLIDAAELGDESAQNLVDDYDLTNERLDALRDTYLTVTAATSETDRETVKLSTSMGHLRDREQEAAEKAQAYADQVDKTATDVQVDIDAMQAKWDELRGTLDRDKSWIGIQQQVADVKIAIEEAGTIAKEKGPGSPEAIAANQDAQLKMIDLKDSVIDYGQQILGLPPEKVTALLAEIDQQNFDSTLSEMDRQLLNHTFRINAHLDTIVVDGETHAAGATTVSTISVRPDKLKGSKASGGGISEAGVYQVHHDELVELPRGAYVNTASEARGGAGAGLPPMTNHFHGVTDPREISRLIAREVGWKLRSGG